SNMKGVGAFDDVVLSYDDGEKEKRVFLQAKHVENKENERKKITIGKFKNKEDKLYLGKYLLGFLESKKKYSDQSTDPVFKGNFQDLDCRYVIYTNAILNSKFPQNRIVNVDNMILTTKKSGKAFKFLTISNENNDLINMLEDVARLEGVTKQLVNT